MSALKNVVEPGVIVLVFTIGALVNRRRDARQDDPEAYAPLLARFNEINPTSSSGRPDSSRFRDNLMSKFLAKFPFVMEIWYWNLSYWIYQLARALSATLIRHNTAIFSTARHHALSILSLEKRVGFAVELSLQRLVLGHAPSLMNLFATIYYSHIIVGVAFLVYIYTYLPTYVFRKIRRTIATNNLIAFGILTAYRCAPPRLLPPEYGFVDVLHGGLQHSDPGFSSTSGSAWTHNRFQLTIAAMPSLHFGTALFLCICLLRFSPHRMLRIFAPLWPTAMLITILATANHFVLDALVGAAVPALGWRWNRLWLVLEPLEDWAFWMLRIEKPKPAGAITARRAWSPSLDQSRAGSPDSALGNKRTESLV
ncbi:PAP2 superfamily-domain-containing protein [Phyllosticta citricarpa]|uniref:PAP2 superfamily-domain-containing protein n=2 Tax=Phyllosticta TaxID=121621 RepID=A0ABR1MEV1_9PEZI